ncbi:MAG: NUDIX hydrolase [Acidobacteria bacterium]|nr:MAG: NUDIX hydrolase [Acidobacteriota bacterium]
MTKFHNPVNLWAMVREISAGGVVIRRLENAWWTAVIEPRKDDLQKEAVLAATSKPQKVLFALPKGLVDLGEKPEQTALREVREETGITALPIAKLADIKYVYVRSWSDNLRVFKIVSFYLLRYQSGEIDDIAPEMRIEVNRALWIPLADAAKKLGYSNERKVIRLAEEYLQSHPEV